MGSGCPTIPDQQGTTLMESPYSLLIGIIRKGSISVNAIVNAISLTIRDYLIFLSKLSHRVFTYLSGKFLQKSTLSTLLTSYGATQTQFQCISVHFQWERYICCLFQFADCGHRRGYFASTDISSLLKLVSTRHLVSFPKSIPR